MTHRVWAISGAALSAVFVVVALLIAPAPPASAATFTTGLTSITGTSDDWGNQNGMSATQVTSGTTGGGLTKVSLYIGTVNASPANHGQVAVYSDVNDAPGAKLAASGSQVLTAKKWNDFLLSGVNVAASTKYWLAFNVDGSNTKYKMASTGGRGAWKIPTTFGTWPDPFGAPSSVSPAARYAITMTWDGVVAPPATTVPPPTTTTPPTTTSSTPPPPPSGSWPTQSTAGVPAGTLLTTINGDLNANQANQVIDGQHITGNLNITASGVTVKNTQVDGNIANDVPVGGMTTVTDVTIGASGTCITAPGIDTPNDRGGYSAARVKVIGHDDGFRAGGPNITIRDSYVKSCVGPTSHADGVQDYPSASNLTIDHNTFDLCGNWTTPPTTHAECTVPGANGPIFIHAGGPYSTGVTITNNLAMGGTYTMYLNPGTAGSTWTVTGNRVVANVWEYGSYETEGHCAGVTWSDNDTAVINANYETTGTAQDNVACPA